MQFHTQTVTWVQDVRPPPIHTLNQINLLGASAGQVAGVGGLYVGRDNFI